MTLTALFAPFLTALLLSWILLLLVYRRALQAAWREPVLRRPVVVIESDDWGPAAAADGTALTAIADCLRSFSDRDGNHPVMTLGVVLATIDVEAMHSAANGIYQRITLADARVATVRRAMLAGVEGRVFSLQLHGLEHYRPATLQAAAHSEATVRDWMSGGPFPATEDLPSALQSRWTDGSQLPSVDLERSEIEAALKEEVTHFVSIFARRPLVYVPTTFVWPEALEAALVNEGIAALITPGTRYVRRGADGRPLSDGRHFVNGRDADKDLVYLVRDIYFEPVQGHTATQAMTQIVAHLELGRPALLETHRNNFTGTAERCAASLRELHDLLRQVSRIPGVLFVSSLDIARSYAGTGPVELETKTAARLGFAIRRLLKINRLRKLAIITGLALVLYPASYLLSGRRTVTGPWMHKPSSINGGI